MKKLFSFILIFLLICFSGCNKSALNKQDTPIIAVTIIPQKVFVESICGDTVRVITMIPPGASPETYEPTPVELEMLSQADIYFSIGISSEETILQSVNNDTEIIELHKTVEKNYPDIIENSGRDPHIWLSPKRVIVMAEKITQVVQEKYSKNADLYQNNLANYKNKLLNLDSEIKTIFSKTKTKSFISFHPAFQYFANDYGLKQYSLEEHGKEANAKHMAEIADIAKKNNIKTIFYQAEASSRQAEAFAEEIGGKAVELEPLAYNYIENLKRIAENIGKAEK